MLFGVATPKITSTLLFRALLLHIPVHSSFTPPSFLPLETLISPHKISISRTISFVGTPSGLRKISIWTATFINAGWNYFRLNSSVSNLTNDRKKCSESGYEDSFIAQSSLSCRDELTFVATTPRCRIDLQGSRFEFEPWLVLGRSRRHE